MDRRPIRVELRPPEEEAPRSYVRPGKRGLLGILAMLAVTVVVAQSCQKAQVRVPQERAVATARAELDFTPRRTQVRLVRQGLNGRPYWAVSFSVPARSGDGYAKLTTVRVDANTGAVAAVNREQR
jgi:hypothetical protein